VIGKDRVIALLADVDPARGSGSVELELEDLVRQRVVDMVAADVAGRGSRSCVEGQRRLRRGASLVVLFALSMIAAAVALGAFGDLARARQKEHGRPSRIGSVDFYERPSMGEAVKILSVPVAAICLRTARRQTRLRPVSSRATLPLDCCRASGRRQPGRVLAPAREALGPRSVRGIQGLARSRHVALAGLPAAIG
jgi:hypothetical protein